MSQQTVGARVSHNAISNYIGQAYSMFITLASVPIFIKYLGTEAYGLIGFFVLLQNFTSFLDFGLSITINRLIAQAKVIINGFAPFGYLLKAIEYGFMIVSIAITTTMYLNSDFISSKWIKSTTLAHTGIAYSLELMSLIIALKLYATFYRSGINGFEDQIWNNKVNILINTLKYGGSIVLLIFFSQNITTYFEYQLIIAVFEVIVLRQRFYKNMPNLVVYHRSDKIDWLEILKIVPFALSITYTSAAVIIIMQLDKLLLSSTISLKELGYLNVISSVTGLILVMATPIFLAYFPKITALAANNKAVEMRAVYTDMTKIVALITASATAMIACNAEGIIYAITGSRAAQAWSSEVLVYYAIGTGFYVLGSVPYYLLNSLGNLKLYVLGCTISLVFLTPAIFFIVQTYGVLGVSYLWMLYGFIWFILWGMLVHNKVLPKFHTQWLFKDIAPLVVSTGITTFIVSYLINISENESRALIVVQGLVIGAVILLTNAFWLKGFRVVLQNIFDKTIKLK